MPHTTHSSTAGFDMASYARTVILNVPRPVPVTTKTSLDVLDTPMDAAVAVARVIWPNQTRSWYYAICRDVIADNRPDRTVTEARIIGAHDQRLQEMKAGLL